MWRFAHWAEREGILRHFQSSLYTMPQSRQDLEIVDHQTPGERIGVADQRRRQAFRRYSDFQEIQDAFQSPKLDHHLGAGRHKQVQYVHDGLAVVMNHGVCNLSQIG